MHIEDVMFSMSKETGEHDQKHFNLSEEKNTASTTKL